MQRVLGQLMVLAALIAGVSMQSHRYREDCTVKEDCLDDFVCLSLRCECPENHTVASDGLQCLPEITYGEPCRESVQCENKMNNTYCGKSSTCECAPGFGFNITHYNCSDIIDNVVPYKGKCRVNRQCKTDMVCEGHICDCKAGLLWNQAAHRCLQKLPRLPGTCDTNEHCLQHINTECRNGLCSCKYGFRPAMDGHYCIAAVTRAPGTCDSNYDCQQFRDTTCVNGNCLCRGGKRLSVDPQKGYHCSAGAGLRSVVTVMLLSLLLGKTAS